MAQSLPTRAHLASSISHSVGVRLKFVWLRLTEFESHSWQLPHVVGRVSSPLSSWKDVKTYSHYAYLVTEAASAPDILVVDLSAAASGTITVAGNVTASAGVQSTHNVFIDEASGFLYRLGGGNGNNPMRVYSLANPSSPEYIATIGDGYVHDAEVISFSAGAYIGKQIAFACKAAGAQQGLQIWDVTDKVKPTLLSFISWEKATYSHNVWVDTDRMIAFVADELLWDHNTGR